MKKISLFVSILPMALLLLAGQPCFAQEAQSMAAGARITHMMYQDDSILSLGGDMDNSYDAGLALSADFTYFVTKAVSLEASIGYVTSDMDVEYSGSEYRYATLTQIPIQVTARYHIPINDKFIPYVGGGIGYYINELDRADGSGDFFDGAPSALQTSIDDALGFHLNAGMEIFLMDKLAVNLDLKYILSNTDMGIEIDGMYEMSDSSSLNAFSAGLGVKYYF